MWKKVGEMAETTRKILPWLIGTVTGIPVIGFIGVSFKVIILRWSITREMKRIVAMKESELNRTNQPGRTDLTALIRKTKEGYLS